MGWTTPFTAVTGVLVTAANINGYRDDLNFLNAQPGCRLRRVANQSISNITTTSVSWDTEDLDTDGFIVATSPTVTIPSGLGGRFAITARAQSASALGAGRAFIQVVPTSGITGLPAEFRVPVNNNSADSRYVVSVTIPLLAGDTFVVQVFHSIGAADNHTAWMACSRVGAL